MQTFLQSVKNVSSIRCCFTATKSITRVLHTEFIVPYLEIIIKQYTSVRNWLPGPMRAMAEAGKKIKSTKVSQQLADIMTAIKLQSPTRRADLQLPLLTSNFEILDVQALIQSFVSYISYTTAQNELTGLHIKILWSSHLLRVMTTNSSAVVLIELPCNPYCYIKPSKCRIKQFKKLKSHFMLNVATCVPWSE